MMNAREARRLTEEAIEKEIATRRDRAEVFCKGLEEEIEEKLNSYEIIKESVEKGIKRNNLTIILAQVVLIDNVDNAKERVNQIINDLKAIL